MPTEEDLKAIVVHKKYSSSRKGKGESARKRKRSSSSDSSHTSISSETEHKSEIKQEAKSANPDVGFIPSRFLKDKPQRRSSSRRREEETLVSYPGYKESKSRRDEVKRERSLNERRDERRDDSRRDESRRDESRRDESRRDDRRDDRRDERRDERRDDRRHEEDDRGRRDRDHDNRRDDRGRVDDDNVTRRPRAEEDNSRGSRNDYQKSFSNQRRDPEQSRHRRGDEDNRRKPREDPERVSGKRSSSIDSNKRKGRRDEDEDYDPISDEELAMLEEDAGIIEIYKELEREMRSKRYTANLDSVDFTALDLLKPEKKLEPEPGTKDPIDRLLKCGYSANYGGKAITEKIKALSLQRGVEAPLNGAFSANKKTLRTVFQETLSPHIALSSHTDLLLRQKLALLSRDKNVSEIVLTDEPVNNTLLNDSVKLFNQMAGTNLEVK